MMKRLKNERGVALVFTLLVVLILLALSSIFIIRTVNEANLAEREREEAKAFYLAEGGAHSGLDGLDNLINNFMTNFIGSTNPATVISNTQNYVGSGDGIGFLIYAVKDAGAAVLTQVGTDATYTVSSTSFGGGTYDYLITFSEKSNPTTVTADSWDFPYYYRIEASGDAAGSDKEILLTGDFTVRIQRDNFAKYALFTNQQTLPSGTNVWFTDKTNFAGPLHSNGRYNVYGNPSGTFEGLVEQFEQTARYYNSGSSILLDADFNGTEDVPTWNAGFNRDAAAITLSSPTQQQDLIDQSTGSQTFASDGIYVPHNSSTGVLEGGIYVKGSDASVALSTDGSNNAVYTISQGSYTKTITVDDLLKQTTVDDGSTVSTYTGVPDGIDDVGTIIYVDGNVSSIAGTVQEDTSLTIASDTDIVVTDNVVYSSYTPAVGTPGTAGYVPPNANGADNLLGLVSWNGDVRVGTAAPDNVNIHGTILASSGILQVDSYSSQAIGPRGDATILGGVISDYYGAFGTFSGSTGQQLSGYGRNFVYDDRMASGSAPPYFPTLNTFIAFTNDITDKMIWQEGDS